MRSDPNRPALGTALGTWAVRRCWWIVLGAALVVLGAGSGVRRLTFSNDLRVFFSPENPQLQALELLEGTYNKEENVLFAVAPKSGEVFSRETLAVVEQLTEAAWQIPFSTRVNSVTNFQHTRAEGDELIVEDLVGDAAALTDAELERVKRVALSEPLLINRLISPSGHVTGVYAHILTPGDAIDEVPEVTVYARRLVDDLRRDHPEIDFYLNGTVVADNAFAEATIKDMTTLTPAMLATLLIILGVSLRSLAATGVTLIVITVSTISAMGLAGWLGIVLTPASGNAPIIILTLAVADSVHILVTVIDQMRQGKAKRDAIPESLRVNLQPVLLTSLTTALGFLSMNFSDAPPFRDLGNIVAMGVVAALLYSLFLLPALVAVLPLRVRPSAAAGNPACDRLADFVIARRGPILWGSLALAALLTSGIGSIELGDDWIKYFDESFAIRRSTDFMEQNLTGWYQIEYSLDSGAPGGINQPEYLATVERFANWYRRQPKVLNVNTISETIKRLNQNLHGDDPAFYRIPAAPDLAAQYLLLYELSLPFGHDLKSQINVDRSATRFTVTLRGTTTPELRAADQRARDWLAANAPETMFTYGSGPSIIWAHLSERNIHSMLGASFGALLLISATLIFALRSFKLGAISLIPNLAPAFMAFGIWGLTVGRVGLGLSVVVSLTIGIVVDDTIHFLSKYLRARREKNLNSAEAVRYAFNTVGTAMWVTTAALVAGFLVLSLSGYKMNAEMALMTAITISLALLLDFFLLPTLLMRIDGGQR